jgi:hypothetical protein
MAVYRRVPILVRESPPAANPWEVEFTTMFHMTNDSGLFRTREQLDRDGWRLEGNVFYRGTARYLPLYEARMVHQFNHRHGDYRDVTPGKSSHQLPEVVPERLRDPKYVPLPRYWVPAEEVSAALEDRWSRGWLLGWRDVTDARASARTVIAPVIPRVGVGNKIPLMLPGERTVSRSPALVANLAAFVCDYASRQKVGGTTLNFFILKQLPVLPPTTYEGACTWDPSQSVCDWLVPRVVELTYTAWDLAPFARDCGYDGPPFRWNEERRFLLRCELDAAFFHLYGIARDDVDYIMDTFPIVRRNDEQRQGEYRTKRVILEIYDAMQEAVSSGRPYGTRLDPPPADRRMAHPGDRSRSPAIRDA